MNDGLERLVMPSQTPPQLSIVINNFSGLHIHVTGTLPVEQAFTIMYIKRYSKMHVQDRISLRIETHRYVNRLQM